jgi:peptidoglycan-associated lipoprotein
MNGGFIEANVNVKKWFGVAGEVTGGHATDIGPLGQNLTFMTYMGGPRVELRRYDFTPFGEFLLGGARGTGSYFPSGTTATSSATSFAWSVGGGLDLNLTPRFAIRAFDVQYLHTGLPNGADNYQNQLQVSAGVVFRFGVHTQKAAPPTPPAPPRNSEIEFSCSVTTPEVTPGNAVQIVGSTMTLPDRLDVSYSWTTNAGAVHGEGRMITVDTANLTPGSYRVDGRASLVSDPSVSSTCEVTFHVRNEMASQNQAPPAEVIVPPGNGDDDFHQHVIDAFFNYDSSHLRSDAKAAVAHDAAYLNEHPEIHITIAGYADERGSAEYNIALGLKRATTTMKALAAAGVDKSRMQVLSYGKEKPFCTEDTQSCFQQNRRAQFVRNDK